MAPLSKLLPLGQGQSRPMASAVGVVRYEEGCLDAFHFQQVQQCSGVQVRPVVERAGDRSASDSPRWPAQPHSAIVPGFVHE